MEQRYVIGGVCALIILGIGMFFGFGKSDAEQKNSGDFMATFKSTENAVLVDVRTGDEYAGGHIARAVNVDFYDPAFVEKMKTLGTDKNFFIYCRSGNRSGQAVSTLTQAGLTVQDLKGGIGSHPELLQ
jgi:rhodanese-related sulfurtransferase